ncbi:Ribonuclease III domain [Macleaya cordata]|uniref:Ribonuclease III domain n=1 Tax=Macleaya cordata TaxID=56857 RepID=A0A200PPY7_MACCD|nr:Ribonuclease III domain [Macleaya cordata]
MGDGEEAVKSSSSQNTVTKDPRRIARKYQLELCKKAVKENVIVYLETGCGKTHIAVLLICELGHLIRKPQRKVCVFLAPTIPLVQQQATVIEESTDFRVGSYFGRSKHLRNHEEWAKEIEEYEVLVMTPQILLQNLHHCFIRMELIALLIFDECHHAQEQSSHPYAQIMKEFYRTDDSKHPRIFGMTASPIVGKGGSNQESLPKGINSLEKLLDAKVYTVDDKEELERFVASPKVKFYYYGQVATATSTYHSTGGKKLEDIKNECMSLPTRKKDDLSSLQNNKKLLQRLHENLMFCLNHLGLQGATQAVRVLLSGDDSVRSEMIETEDCSNVNSLAEQYLTQAATVLGSYFTMDGTSSSFSEILEEPFFSNKLLVLIKLLSSTRLQSDMKCIIFVNRIIVARSLSYILGNLKCLEFWKCHYLVGYHSGLKNMSRKIMNSIVEKFRSGELNLLVATKVAEEGLDIQTCCLVIRFDLPETVASFIQSRGRARMAQSEYAFLVDRGNQNELNLIEKFMSDENRMNEEILCRTSTDTFDELGETIYTVGSTGASTSEVYSVELLHHYCSKLPRDEYFNPMPEFFYFDDLNGKVCCIILPSNAPIHQVVGVPKPSKESAKKNACLKACEELHQIGALTDYLLPGQDYEEEDGVAEFESCEDESSLQLHEMLSPTALKVPWSNPGNPILLNFYFVQFVPVPEDRSYQQFGLFVKEPLPNEVETMQLDLHLARGRIVKTQLVSLGMIEFDKDEIMQAQNFQEMFLKIILDRSHFFSDFVPLGKNDSCQASSPTFYLLLPMKQNEHKVRPSVDWELIRNCLSSAIFRSPKDTSDNDPVPKSDSLKFANGSVTISVIVNSLVFTPHNKLFFFVDDILHGIDAESPFTSEDHSSYTEYYIQKFGIHLLHPEQPLLKAKQLFNLRNLLYNRVQQSTDAKQARELEEHFVELPPELCVLKIMGFSKDIGSSLSLLPSLMQRVENLLVAIELKDIFSASFPEGSEVTAHRVLEALTTEKCAERFSLERLEVLGDAFLKYAVGRHLFLLYDTLDEGMLTRKRSTIVNNSNLYNLAIGKNLQVYIRDEMFDPCQFFAYGRPCKVICNEDTKQTIHSQQETDVEGETGNTHVRCSKGHHWLHKKTIADVVEALVGAFIVDSGFKGAIAFLKWIGIQVEFNALEVTRACLASKSYMSLGEIVDTSALENLLGYKFLHKGLLLQALVHPSYNKHSGGCYQRLEFLGDAVLDYLITSYLYSVYPKLKPGQLTDLRSVAVNNTSFAKIAVRRSFHKYLICDSDSLSEAIREYANFVQTSASKNCQLQEPTCPKALGDLVESCVGAMLLDTGFNLNDVWKIMLSFLDPIMSFSSLQLNPVRELQELCQSLKWDVQFHESKKGGNFLVKAEVCGKHVHLTSSATNRSKKAATRTVAREIFSKLKAQGYRPKNKPLEEVLKSSIKQNARLIGFNETPTKVVATDSILLENFEKLNVSTAANDYNPDTKATNKEPTNTSYQSMWASPIVANKRHQSETSEDGSCGNASLIGNGVSTSSMGSAKSRLLEACAANYWNPPLFECCKEEGPPHSKLFTFKVSVEIVGASNMVLDSFGEPRAKKKAAAEHAAQGALWYLQREGLLTE